MKLSSIDLTLNVDGKKYAFRYNKNSKGCSMCALSDKCCYYSRIWNVCTELGNFNGYFIKIKNYEAWKEDEY